MNLHISAETAIYLTAGVVGLMVVIVALIAALVILDGLAAWPRRAATPVSPGTQYWVRSTQTDTAPIVLNMDGRRIA